MRNGVLLLRLIVVCLAKMKIRDVTHKVQCMPSQTKHKRSTKYDYICPHEGCDKVFNRPNRLETHARIHTGERPYLCDVVGCVKTYARPAHLKRHKLVFNHSTLQQEREGVSDQESDPEKKARKRRKNSFKCPEPGCCVAFTKLRKLTAHKAQHENFVYPCICSHPGCGRGFIYMSKLRKHMKIHEGYECTAENCEQVFATWTLYRRHFASTHKLKRLPCSRCEKTFPRPSVLAKHERTHDNDRDMLECPRGCGRSYMDPRTLAQHLRSYHEGRRFPCDHPGCDRRFVAKCSLQAHLKSHENPQKSVVKKARSNKHRKKSTATLLTGFCGNYDDSDPGELCLSEDTGSDDGCSDPENDDVVSGFNEMKLKVTDHTRSVEDIDVGGVQLTDHTRSVEDIDVGGVQLTDHTRSVEDIDVGGVQLTDHTRSVEDIDVGGVQPTIPHGAGPGNEVGRDEGVELYEESLNDDRSLSVTAAELLDGMQVSRERTDEHDHACFSGENATGLDDGRALLERLKEEMMLSVLMPS